MKARFTIIILTTTLFFHSKNTFGQASICLGDDITVCVGSPVTIDDCEGGQGVGLINSLYLNNPTQVFLTDDQWSGAVPLGFSFSIYGNSYTQTVIGSNGVLSFNIANAGGYCPWALGGVGQLPTAGFPSAFNSSMLCYMDMNPSAGGNIYYQTVGTAPNRKFVVLYQNVEAFGQGGCNYMAVILNETSNVIEYNIGNKVVVAWNGGLAIQGAENNNGSVAHITPARNNTQWGANLDNRIFTPTSPNNTLAYTISSSPYQFVYTGNPQWTNTLGQNFPYNNGVLNIPSAASGSVGYFLTSATVGSCAGGAGVATSDTSWVTGVSSAVAATSTPDICSSGAGSVTATPLAGVPPFTFNWPALGSTAPTVNGVYGGNYLVTMNDGMGCPSSTIVFVGDTPANYSTESTPVSCPGGSDGTATATMIPNLGNITYQWDDPAMQTTQTAVSLTAGTYNCLISSDIGCSNTVTVVVTEIPGMLANFSTVTFVSCNSDNDGILVVDVINGTGPYTYAWDNSSSTTNTANDLYARTHTVTITDAMGCVISLTETLIEPDSLKITYITPNTQICSEDDILLEVTGVGGSTTKTYTWFEGANMVGTGNSITVDPITTNTEYCVVLSEACGSPIDSKCVTITFPTPIVPILTPTYSQDCVVGKFEFWDNSENASEIATTFIDFGDFTSTVENNADSVYHEYDLVGSYTMNLLVTSIYGCIYENTLTDIITVVPNPTAHFFFSDNPVSVFETTVKAYDKSTADVVSWEWIAEGSTTSSSTLQNPTFVYPENVPGDYPVTLIVTSNYGCTDTLTHLLTVQDELLFFAPNTFTPDGDEFNQLWRLVLKSNNLTAFNVQIFNRWGEIIWESNDYTAGWDGTYDGRTTPAGTYTWKATIESNSDFGKGTYTGKINLLR
jgi:gliding motility-associated-like protein